MQHYLPVGPCTRLAAVGAKVRTTWHKCLRGASTLTLGISSEILRSSADSNPQPEIIELLVRNGADINARSTGAYSEDVTIGDTPCMLKLV